MGEYIDKIKLIFKEINKVVFSSLLFYRNPRKFINNLLKESTEKILKEISTYLTVYFFIILSFASIIYKGSILNYWKIIGLQILFIILSIPIIFSIYLSLKISKINNPLKISIVSIILLQIFYGIFVNISYILFLITENYRIFFKIYSLFIQLMTLIIFFAPIFALKESKKKIFISTFLNIILILLLILFFFRIESQGIFKSTYSIDPIFEEFDKNMIKASFINSKQNVEFFGELQEIFKMKKVELIDSVEIFNAQQFSIKSMTNQIKLEIKYFKNKENIFFSTNILIYKNYYLNYLNLVLKFLNKSEEMKKYFEYSKLIKRLEPREKELKEKSRNSKIRLEKMKNMKKFKPIVKKGEKLIPLIIYKKYLEAFEYLNEHIKIRMRIFNLKKKNYSLRDSIYNMYITIQKAKLTYTQATIRYLAEINIAYSYLLF